MASAENALTWLKQRAPSRPFFIWAHFNNAHYTYKGGGAPPDMFVGDEHYQAGPKLAYNTNRQAKLELDVPREHPCAYQILRTDIGQVHRAAVLRERPDEHGFYIARYDAGIFGADLAIGILLKGLREKGLLENTIIALVGDHGESLGDHNYFFEHGRFAYDSCAQVPMMIRPAGGISPRRIDTPVAAFAMGATVVELVGLEAPDDWQAKSLWPLVNGRGGSEFVFTESGYQLDYQLAVRDNEWKLIHVPNRIDRQLMQGTEYELYRWRDDPGETSNLADKHPEQVKRLAKVLKQWSAPWIDAAYGRTTQKQVELDEETLRHLQSLGYIEGGDDDDGD